MRFKRLVSGIAALTVAMGTFATMTITALAEPKFTNVSEEHYSLVIVNESGAPLNAKATTMAAFKGKDALITTWNDIQVGESLPYSYLSSDEYMVEAVTDNYLTDTEFKALTDRFPYTTNGYTVTQQTGGSTLDDAEFTITAHKYYWHTVKVHETKEYSLAVKKIVGSKSPVDFGQGLETDNLTGFQNGKWSYKETETQSGTGTIKVPRFVDGGDGNAYELSQGPIGYDTSGYGITHEDNSFEVKVNKETFVGRKSNYEFSLHYGSYSRPNGVPSGATLQKIVEATENETTDANASMGKKGGSSVTIDNLEGGQQYYFVVTHSSGSTINGKPEISMAFIDDSQWTTSVVSAIAKADGDKEGKITITLDGGNGNIDTVLVYSEATKSLKVNVTASGVSSVKPSIEGNSDLIQGDPNMPNVTYSFPRYAEEGGKLYIANGIVDNGSHMTLNGEDVAYKKTISGDTLKSINSDAYNVQILYSSYTADGVTGEFKELKEFDGESGNLHEDKNASNGKCEEISSSLTYYIETAGKHRLVVRYNGSLQAEGVDGDTGNLSNTNGAWQEAILTVTVTNSELTDRNNFVTFQPMSGNCYIDSILDYSEPVASSVSIVESERKVFNNQTSNYKDGSYTAYIYNATLIEGSDGADFNIGVYVGDEKSKPLRTVLTAAGEGESLVIRFGVIAPSDSVVKTYYEPSVD